MSAGGKGFCGTLLLIAGVLSDGINIGRLDTDILPGVMDSIGSCPIWVAVEGRFLLGAGLEIVLRGLFGDNPVVLPLLLMSAGNPSVLSGLGATPIFDPLRGRILDPTPCLTFPPLVPSVIGKSCPDLPMIESGNGAVPILLEFCGVCTPVPSG